MIAMAGKELKLYVAYYYHGALPDSLLTGALVAAGRSGQLHEPQSIAIDFMRSSPRPATAAL
jgi:hypothetical protein